MKAIDIIQLLISSPWFWAITVVWNSVGIGAHVWLERRWFRYNVNAYGVKYAMRKEPAVWKKVLRDFAAGLTGPFMILVARIYDPMRRFDSEYTRSWNQK